MILNKRVRDTLNGETWSLYRILLLAYPDEIICTGNNRADVQIILKKLMKARKNIGLVVYVEKTKYMVVSRASKNF